MLNKIYVSSQVLLDLPRYTKKILAFFLDIGICILTVWLAYYLRLGEFVSLSNTGQLAVILSIALALPIFLISGLYNIVFRHSGFHVIFLVFRSIIIYGILYSAIITAFGVDGIPRTIGIIQPILLFIGIGSSRMLIRFWLGQIHLTSEQKKSLKKILIYGAGSAGRQLAASLHNNSEMKPIGFLDDDVSLKGSVIESLKVFSLDQLKDLITRKNVSHILMALPSLSRSQRHSIIERLSKYQLIIRTVPSINAIADNKVSISDIQDLDIEDLLGRTVVAPNKSLLNKKIFNNTVLVTGAGGSIGSELCRQIIRLEPKKLLLLELNEFALYTIQAELKSIQDRSIKGKKIEVIPIIASVQDYTRIKHIINQWKPNTIYHTAAYKHVSLVENNFLIGLKNNVIGTFVMARAAIENSVQDFVMISTDKAVRPTNAMGASKRLSEIILQSIFESQSQKKLVKFSMVRFGNVLNSSGSIIPLFKKQIENNGPITITDPNVTRYFMTVSEAAELVIQAGAMADGGEVFILDMGKPIKIIELAKRMVTLSGLSLKESKNSEGDIEIKIIGLRSGEKIYEELLLGNDPQPTLHSKILKAQEIFLPWEYLEKEIKRMEKMINANDENNLIYLLQKLVPEYKPSKKIANILS